MIANIRFNFNQRLTENLQTKILSRLQEHANNQVDAHLRLTKIKFFFTII